MKTHPKLTGNYDMFRFDSSRYGLTVQHLLVEDRPCDLGPGKPRRSQHEALSQLDIDTLFADQEISDGDMAHCCLAALWLNHDFLDESHTISQSVHSPTGSYWHGIMHRRETDYSNAKYWFRRTDNHEIFPELCLAARELAQTQTLDQETHFLVDQANWEAADFVDLCQVVTSSNTDSEFLAQKIAHVEWQLLFNYCYQRAL